MLLLKTGGPGSNKCAGGPAGTITFGGGRMFLIFCVFHTNVISQTSQNGKSQPSGFVSCPMRWLPIPSLLLLDRPGHYQSKGLRRLLCNLVAEGKVQRCDQGHGQGHENSGPSFGLFVAPWHSGRRKKMRRSFQILRTSGIYWEVWVSALTPLRLSGLGNEHASHRPLCAPLKIALRFHHRFCLQAVKVCQFAMCKHQPDLVLQPPARLGPTTIDRRT